jgi:hypothetical protein
MRTPAVAAGQVGRWLVLILILVVILDPLLALALVSGGAVFVPVRSFAEFTWPARSLATLLVLVLVLALILILTLVLGKLWASAIPVTVDIAVPAWPVRSFDLLAITILAVVRWIEVKVTCPKRKGICPRHRRRPAVEGCVPMSSAVGAGWAGLVSVTLIPVSVIIIVVVVIITVGVAIPGSVWSHFEFFWFKEA